MNLSPTWVAFLTAHGVEALHWSAVGDARAPDHEIMEWARTRGYSVFTNDLDFSAILAQAGESGPSVIQVRTQDVLPAALGTAVLNVLREHADAIERGAIVSIDRPNSRVRILPIRQPS